jgi:hypothetical protein
MTILCLYPPAARLGACILWVIGAMSPVVNLLIGLPEEYVAVMPRAYTTGGQRNLYACGHCDARHLFDEARASWGY